ncbi:MAG TPA: chemotaxis response regulator protein-glutamate methylesterase, partial [Thiohalobacter sp.]|nr:chemotaxis response regulator protein-glutamate methylesterase [Thiohalobacter sp.]
MLRIAIVNDMPLARQALQQLILASGRYRIAWVAEDGAQAVELAEQDKPDIILMDLIMPELDGVEATRRIMQQAACAIVIVTSSVNTNAARVFEAMGAGALDAINTPVLGLSGEQEGREQLLYKLDTVARLVEATRRVQPLDRPQPPPPAVPHRGEYLVAIGASTGGPAAIRTLLSAFPVGFPAAFVVIQHVDEQFAPSFARWLDEEVPLPVRLAREGERIRVGEVLVAGRGEAHLVMDERQRLGYTRVPENYPYRPSVNVFFESMAQFWTHHAVGILLTGMGRDGGAGLLALKQAGCHTIAQDRETSAIYGMPKTAADLQAASEILPLDRISVAIEEAINRNKG